MIDHLIKLVRESFSQIPDHRRSVGNKSYELVDLLSAGFAVFSLKEPSLLAFRREYPNREANLRRVYGIESVPGDTALREGLDGVEPARLQGCFGAPLGVLRHQGVFKSRLVLGGYLAVAVDGTGHYGSSTHSCPHCMVRNHRGGKQSFYHQLLAAVQVHPEQATVFPLGAEAIVNGDGAKKNDCEFNAAKRLIPQLRQSMPHGKLLLNLDALYANGPMIKLLAKHRMSFLIGIKDGNYVQIQVDRLRKDGGLETKTWAVGPGKEGHAEFANGLILNGTQQELTVNYLEYTETDTQTGEMLYYSSWITDLPISQDNVQEMVAVARSRWKIENETFNTLKNQGYHLEHNYGHGKQYLATNFALLTMLAFLTDQIAQHLDLAFQKAWQYCQTKKAFWQKVRQVFDLLPAVSMNAIYRFIAKDIKLDFPLLE